MSTLTQLSDAELDAVTGGLFDFHIGFNIANVGQAAANVAGVNILSLQAITQVAAVSQH